MKSQTKVECPTARAAALASREDDNEYTLEAFGDISLDWGLDSAPRRPISFQLLVPRDKPLPPRRLKTRAQIAVSSPLAEFAEKIEGLDLALHAPHWTAESIGSVKNGVRAGGADKLTAYLITNKTANGDGSH